MVWGGGEYIFNKLSLLGELFLLVCNCKMSEHSLFHKKNDFDSDNWQGFLNENEMKTSPWGVYLASTLAVDQHLKQHDMQR